MDRLTLLDRLMRWLYPMRLPRAEEVRMRYRAIRGKSVRDYETEILEKLYAQSPDA